MTSGQEKPQACLEQNARQQCRELLGCSTTGVDREEVMGLLVYCQDLCYAWTSRYGERLIITF
jgi:hypothetical protein